MLFYAILMAHWTSPTLSNCSQIKCNMVDFAHSQTSHPRASLPTTPRFNKKKRTELFSVHACMRQSTLLKHACLSSGLGTRAVRSFALFSETGWKGSGRPPVAAATMWWGRTPASGGGASCSWAGTHSLQAHDILRNWMWSACQATRIPTHT